MCVLQNLLISGGKWGNLGSKLPQGEISYPLGREAAMPMTDAKARNAKPKSKQFKIFYTDGLFLLVSSAGAKWWRLKYRLGGKEKLISLV